MTAGIDLALALVADDHGAPTAADVNRQLVVYVRASGGQGPVLRVAAGPCLDSKPVRDLLSWSPTTWTVTCPPWPAG